eukprot:scaffold5342_cov101-Isochrysis_galbana.AAC.2
MPGPDVAGAELCALGEGCGAVRTGRSQVEQGVGYRGRWACARPSLIVLRRPRSTARAGPHLQFDLNRERPEVADGVALALLARRILLQTLAELGVAMHLVVQAHQLPPTPERPGLIRHADQPVARDAVGGTHAA